MQNIPYNDTFGAKLSAIRRTALLLVTTVLAVGCPAGKQTPDASITGKVVIKGSNTFGEELAPRLIAEYRKARPNVTIELESKGSESGFAALMVGECDIAGTSRSASKAELEASRNKGIKLEDAVIGYYGVAVVVNTNNPVTKLTQHQVRDVFSGAMQNWKAVGGADAPIQLCIRDKISATHQGFRELAMEKRSYAPGARSFTNYLELAAAVRQDPHAIGYSSMSLAERTGVKDVWVNGMTPTVTSVNEDRYPYARVLHLYTNKAKETTATRDFVRFVQSSRGQRILSEMGFVRRFEPRFRGYLDD